MQEFSGRLATALGVTDIISLCVLALVFLLALYFVWGGTWNKPPRQINARLCCVLKTSVAPENVHY